MDEKSAVQFEMWIQIQMIDETGGIEALRVQIVQDEFADIGRGFLGLSTPLAQAILGRQAGEEIDYRQGDIQSVKILAVEPASDGPDPSVVQRREATLRKAVDQSDRTNAILFASSFNGKWGDYDPSGLIDDPDDKNGS